jgi:hypothetical protein
VLLSSSTLNDSTFLFKNLTINNQTVVGLLYKERQKNELLEYQQFDIAFSFFYSYLPTLIIVIFNSIALYTIYQLCYTPMIYSGPQRDEKIKYMKKNEHVLVVISILFVSTHLPYTILAQILIFKRSYHTVNKINYLQCLLIFFKLLELFGYFFNCFCYLILFKSMRKFILKCRFQQSDTLYINDNDDQQNQQRVNSNNLSIGNYTKETRI